MDKTVVNVKHNQVITVENNGTRVSVTKVREENFTASASTADDILYKIVPPKSFLYRNQKTKKVKTNTAYLPMHVGGQQKRSLSRFFRLSSHEYPIFDLSRFKYFNTANRQELYNDRGYYSIRNQQSNRDDIYREPAPRTRHRSQCSAEDFVEINHDRMYVEEHFYEDLCYNDMTNDADKRKRSNSASNMILSRPPYIVRIQEMFHSFRMPSFFKHSDREMAREKMEKGVRDVCDNNANSSDMYDSVHVNTAIQENDMNEMPIMCQVPKAKVEEYLEPIQGARDYCDVSYKLKDESLVAIIMKMFENFGSRKETNDALHSDSEESREAAKISEPIQKWNESERKQGERVSNMADRPLPVPVENEGYFMDVDRGEAVRLLEGHEDGTFLLRPSSQPNHAYTLSVCCEGSVHNVGVRRRNDGRLALGYARRGERSFSTVNSLLRYHRRKKLLLVAGGTNLGSTTLKESPMYYQVPSGVPVERSA